MVVTLSFLNALFCLTSNLQKRPIGKTTRFYLGECISDHRLYCLAEHCLLLRSHGNAHTIVILDASLPPPLQYICDANVGQCRNNHRVCFCLRDAPIFDCGLPPTKHL